MANTVLAADQENNFLIFSIILILLPILLIILKHFKSSSSQLPPGPFSWPILGNLLQIGSKPHITLTQFAKTYGPLFSIKLGTQLVVVGSTPEAAIEILKTHDRVLSGRPVLHAAPANSMGLNKSSLGWTVECSENWKYLRTICKSELFSNRALESQGEARQKMILNMVNFIKKMEGKAVNIRQVSFAAIFNMLGNVLISKDVISLEHESLQGEFEVPLREMVEIGVSPNLSDLFPVLARFDLQGLQRKSREWFEKTCEIWEDIVHERRKEIKVGASSSQRDFLDVLINNGSTNDEINILLKEMFTAGADSSSLAVEWMLAELIKNPRHMKKVKEEIQRELRNDQDTIQESHLPRLQFLEACFKEMLRLHPPAPLFIPHRAVESCQVMSYTIPKDAQVLVNFWAIARDPKIWEDPLVFKPERFMNSSSDFKGNDFNYIPFGSGRRICLGLPMASKHVPLAVANLVHFFEWSLPNGENPHHLDMNEKYGLTLMKEQPLLLIPKAKK